jgi:hypothetical protein
MGARPLNDHPPAPDVNWAARTAVGPAENPKQGEKICESPLKE